MLSEHFVNQVSFFAIEMTIRIKVTMILKVKDQNDCPKKKKKTKLIITTKYKHQKYVFGDWHTQKYHLIDTYWEIRKF